ncbi:MAG: RHS repeat-associated core domain-containing protein [Proteobacteria bacterium]|nr:RHS repeat-associated core domain-containing protein [Pseudomonadota bacterium]NOG60914.1 RHS repeat-associated core domain-containing protein [Pseudomonadota bacterium]
MKNSKILPGQYYDEETNLHYNYFRYYDPSLGRYITSDPIGLDAGINTYTYVNANPINLIDPKGLVEWTGSFAIGKFKIGKKVKDIPLRIGFAAITLDLESECINDKRVKVTLEIDNIESHEWFHFPTVGFGGKVKLTDPYSTPNAAYLEGKFNLKGKGVIYGKGDISSGSANGSFSGGGLLLGVLDLSGDARWLRKPIEEDCNCGK